ncbi:MAG: MBL fold metallo-hydrolase [Chloroflexi bacterium]|nr:MBL fold metallo-hydrolase [Chloroflexota bacterium]
MTTTTPRTQVVELANGVFARLHEGLTNAGIIVGDEGVIVIDSLRVPSFARDLIGDVRRLSSKPIRYVIDTHSHWDHAWGNEEFPDSAIVGHANCRAEMLDLERVAWWRERARSQDAPWSKEVDAVRVTPPSLTFDTSLRLHFGGREIALRYLGRAHTSGDIYIHLPGDGLLFTGDVAQDGGVPFVLDGYVRDWVDTDARLLELPAERFVSGHGPVGERPALVEARAFIKALAAGAARTVAEGRDEATAGREITAALRERFGGWRGFERVEESARFAHRQAGGKA